jgi:uncharacterized protein (TIGR03435 family)
MIVDRVMPMLLTFVLMHTGTRPQVSAVNGFEVASVKRSGPNSGLTKIMVEPGDRLTASSVPVSLLIQFAYELQDSQLVGARGWVASELFDVQAKAPTGTASGADPVRAMLRSLLADRFKLIIRHETRQLPAYALVVAKPNRPLAPKIHLSTADCQELGSAAATRSSNPSNSRTSCRVRVVAGQMISVGLSISEALIAFSMVVRRQVVDRTGLTGKYDFELTWTPDEPTRSRADVQLPPVDPNGPSFFTAVEEQLGLKLEATRAPIEVLVIDSVEPPTPD